MKLKNKKGDANIIAVVLAIVFVVSIASLTFTWIRNTTSEGTEKSSDKVAANDICNDQVGIRINNIIDRGDSLDVDLENVRDFPITDFIVRMEMDDLADVRKEKQIVGSYESIVLNVQKPDFNPKVIKVIPRITISKPDIQSIDEGWWICSEQLAKYDIY